MESCSASPEVHHEARLPWAVLNSLRSFHRLRENPNSSRPLRCHSSCLPVRAQVKPSLQSHRVRESLDGILNEMNLTPRCRPHPNLNQTYRKLVRPPLGLRLRWAGQALLMRAWLLVTLRAPVPHAAAENSATSRAGQRGARPSSAARGGQSWENRVVSLSARYLDCKCRWNSISLSTTASWEDELVSLLTSILCTEQMLGKT